MQPPQPAIEHGFTADALRGRPVALLGYGNQGRAHALNLRDSGVDVRVSGRPGSSARARASAEGFPVSDPAGAIRGADLVIVALPDEAHAETWRTAIAPNLRPGQTALSALIERLRNPVRMFDAAGLALFAVLGAEKALAYGLGAVSAVLLGTLSGIGGGIARDMLVARTPVVLHSELYAVAAIVGSWFS